MAEGGGVSLRSGSDYIYDFFCEVCVDDNKHVEACGYCVDCEEYLCEECYNAHKRPRSTRHHVLKDKNNMPKDTPMSTDRVNTSIVTRCQSHSAKLVEFYCNAHDVFGCSTCFATVHKNCQKVESIQVKSVNILDSQDYKKFLLNLKTMKENAEEIIKRTSSNAASVQKCCSDFVAAIKQTKEELIKVLNEAEDSMVSLAKKICSEDEREMKNLATECKDASTRIEEISSEIERLQTFKRVCQLYIKMKEISGEITTLGENLRSSQRKGVARNYRFEPNKDVEKMLRAPDILGKILHLKQPVDDVQLTTPVVPSNPMVSKGADAKPTTPVISNVSDIDVRSSNDTKTCRFTGSAVLSNTRVVLADFNNQKVKLVDTHDNKLIGELNLPSRPWDITAVSQNKQNGDHLYHSSRKRIEPTKRIGCPAHIRMKMVVLFPEYEKPEILTETPVVAQETDIEYSRPPYNPVGKFVPEEYRGHVSQGVLKSALVNSHRDEVLLRQRERVETVYVKTFTDVPYKLKGLALPASEIDPNVFNLLCDWDNLEEKLA